MASEPKPKAWVRMPCLTWTPATVTCWWLNGERVRIILGVKHGK